MDQPSIRILVVDDHPLVRKGLAATIDPEPDMIVVGSAGSGQDAVRLFREMRPDITIMDLTLTPEMTGIQAMQAIQNEFPEARVIALSAHQGEETVYRALQSGAKTFLHKEARGDDLIATIREVNAGRRPVPPSVAEMLVDRMAQPTLTPRELTVLELMAKGLRNKEIAGLLCLSERTAQGHVMNILSKLKANDRVEAVTVAIRRGLIHLD